jgi:hypothetical protein
MNIFAALNIIMVIIMTVITTMTVFWYRIDELERQIIHLEFHWWRVSVIDVAFLRLLDYRDKKLFS